MDLDEERLRRLVETVARRVVERLAREDSPAPPEAPTEPAAPFALVPCAIPPPGSPRYETTMRALEAAERPRDPHAPPANFPYPFPFAPPRS